MSARDMILDVLSDVDPKYIAEHMERNQPSAKRKIVRYSASAAVYAAACVAVIMLLPHIIGKAPDEPPVNVPVDPIVSETDVTASGTEETVELPVTVTADESEMTEAVTSEETAEETTEAEEDTTAPVILPPETEEPDVVEEPEEPAVPEEPDIPEETVTSNEAPSIPQVRPAQTTATDTESVPVPENPVSEPSGMVHVSSGNVPYSYIEYIEYSCRESLERQLCEDPVFTSAADFNSFIDKYGLDEDDEDSYGMDEHLHRDYPYFNEAFFAKYNLYMNYYISGSSSNSCAMDRVTIDKNGVLSVNLNIYEPLVQNGMMEYTLYLLAVEKSIVGDSDKVIYTYDTYTWSYDYDLDQPYYIPDIFPLKNLEHYKAEVMPESDNIGSFFNRAPVVMRSKADMESFLSELSAICNGIPNLYFPDLPEAYPDKYFEELTLVYLGMYDSGYIQKSGGIDYDTNNKGELVIKIPAPDAVGAITDNMEMYFAWVSQNICNSADDIAISLIIPEPESVPDRGGVLYYSDYEERVELPYTLAERVPDKYADYFEELLKSPVSSDKHGVYGYNYYTIGNVFGATVAGYGSVYAMYKPEYVSYEELILTKHSCIIAAVAEKDSGNILGLEIIGWHADYDNVSEFLNRQFTLPDYFDTEEHQIILFNYILDFYTDSYVPGDYMTSGDPSEPPTAFVYDPVYVDLKNYIYGDANKDGKANLSDVTIMLQYLADWDNVVNDKSLYDMEHNATNVNVFYNMVDIAHVLKMISGWDMDELVPFILDDQDGNYNYPNGDLSCECASRLYYTD